MSNSIYLQTEQNLVALKLNQMKLHLEEVSNNVGKESLSFTEGLLRLTNYELDFKESSASQNTIHAAAFPFIKTMKDFDFEFQPSVSEKQMQEFCTLGFMERMENIVFLGSSGVGKTHLATAIGISAAQHHNITYFIKCHDLLQQLKKAKLENRLDARLKHLNRYKLLIIDEIGYLPIDKEDSNLFFQLIDMRYEKKSTIFTTNINFSDWDSIFYDAVVSRGELYFPPTAAKPQIVFVISFILPIPACRIKRHAFFFTIDLYAPIIYSLTVAHKKEKEQPSPQFVLPLHQIPRPLPVLNRF